jgi:hypothetical protein
LSTRVTVAPGTTAPLGSVTVPRREVVALWAKPVAVQIDTSKKSAVFLRLFIKAPPKRKQFELR